jgi:hypothetical protein
VDPLAGEYPFYTPYQYASNKPIVAIDLDGLETPDEQNTGMEADAGTTLQNNENSSYSYERNDATTVNIDNLIQVYENEPPLHKPRPSGSSHPAESIGIHQQTYNQTRFLSGEITESELKDTYKAQAYGLAAGAAIGILSQLHKIPGGRYVAQWTWQSAIRKMAINTGFQSGTNILIKGIKGEKIGSFWQNIDFFDVFMAGLGGGYGWRGFIMTAIPSAAIDATYSEPNTVAVVGINKSTTAFGIDLLFNAVAFKVSAKSAQHVASSLEEVQGAFSRRMDDALSLFKLDPPSNRCRILASRINDARNFYEQGLANIDQERTFLTSLVWGTEGLTINSASMIKEAKKNE